VRIVFTLSCFLSRQSGLCQLGIEEDESLAGEPCDLLRRQIVIVVETAGIDENSPQSLHLSLRWLSFFGNGEQFSRLHETKVDLSAGGGAFYSSMLGGAGAVESVAAILALREHVAPPTINLEDLDENVPVDVATEPRPLSKRGSEPMAVLNNAFGFGGHNVSLVFTAA